jgi:hypothetical protein
MCGRVSPDSADPDGLISLSPAGMPTILFSGAGGTTGTNFPLFTGSSGTGLMLPVLCSPVCTMTVADLFRIRRPVFLPGLLMQISL